MTTGNSETTITSSQFKFVLVAWFTGASGEGDCWAESYIDMGEIGSIAVAYNWSELGRSNCVAKSICSNLIVGVGSVCSISRGGVVDIGWVVVLSCWWGPEFGDRATLVLCGKGWFAGAGVGGTAESVAIATERGDLT